MCRILLFNQDLRDQHTLTNQATFIEYEQVLETFGISTGNFTKDSWKEEDHLEYPFSNGSFHPKCSSDEAAATPVRDSSTGLDNVYDEWNSEEEERGLLQDGSQLAKGGVPAKHPTSARLRSSGETPLALSRSLTYSTLPVEGPYDTGIYQEPTISGTTIVIPDQNVKSRPAKKGKGTSMQQDVEKVHQKISRANLHLFDDRVFLVEDKEEAQRLLALNNSKNPIRRRMNPLLGIVMKCFEIQLFVIRATFNVFTWKDPMLSFWFSVLVLCLVISLILFPWRLFFFVVGLLCFGPQNYFLLHLNGAKCLSLFKPTPAKRNSDRDSLMSVAADVSKSPLLFRNNAHMKSDGKRREVIVPGGDCVFRGNRFYDWPPDPATTSVQKETKVNRSARACAA